MSARIWSGAGVASVLLHGAGLAAIALSTEPEVVPDQNIPKSQFSVEAAEVPRSRAAPQTPAGDTAAQADAPSTAAQSGAVPQSRAEPATPRAQALAPAAAGTPVLDASDTAGTVTAPVTSAAQTVAESVAPPKTTAAVALKSNALAPAVTNTTAIASAATKSAPLTPATTKTTALASARTKSTTLASAITKSTAIAPAATKTALLSSAPTKTAALASAPTKTAALSASAPPAPTQVATPAPTQAAALVAAPNTVSAARPVAAPAAPSLTAPARTAPAVVAAALRPEPSAPNPEPVPVVAPSGETTAPSATTGQETAAAAPVFAPAPSAQPEATQSEAMPLPALAGKAALAWSGEEDTPVSATSLAAIAAFTQAGDLQAASAQIRDGIEGILASVPCARLQTTFLPDTGQLELRGHIPEDGLRGPVLAALQEQIGGAIKLSDQLLVLPRPQCGALSGIADVGLPQSTEQLNDPAVIGEDGFARTYAYSDGERLRLDLTAPDYDSYIYMDYFVADGSVIHLQPNEIVPLEFAPAKSAQSVGRARDGKPFLELTVSPPFGQEIAAAFAASVPLYEEPRPIQEPAEAYLAFLKERVAAARAAHPDFKGEWVYFFISTEAG